jgi:hypothetical protein
MASASEKAAGAVRDHVEMYGELQDAAELVEDILRYCHFGAARGGTAADLEGAISDRIMAGYGPAPADFSQERRAVSPDDSPA